MWTQFVLMVKKLYKLIANQSRTSESCFLFCFGSAFESTQLPWRHINCHGRHLCCVKRGPLNTPKEKHNAVLTRLLKIVAAIIPQRITSAKCIAASAPKTNIDVWDHTALSELFLFPLSPLRLVTKCFFVISDCHVSCTDYNTLGADCPFWQTL